MEKIRNTYIGILLVIQGASFGQDGTLTNTGITILIQSDVLVYVGGDYEDKGKETEDGIVLEGTFEISGDLSNNSDRGTLFSSNTVNINKLLSVLSTVL